MNLDRAKLNIAWRSVVSGVWFAAAVVMGDDIQPPLAARLEFVSEGRVRIGFEGNPGVPYSLWRSTGQTALSDWQMIGGVNGGQRLLAVDDATPPPGAAFYQVRPDVAPFSELRLQNAAGYSAQRGGSSVLVMQSGQLVFEAYQNGAGPETSLHIASATKVFFACALAAAIEDGLISGYDEVVADTITEWRNASLHPLKRSITVRHLVELSSGLSHDIDQIQGGDPAAPDIYHYVVNNLRVVRAPGSAFSYGPSHYFVFGVLLQRKLNAAGIDQNPLEYLETRILDRIGVEYTSWFHDDAGNPHIPNGAHLTPRNWARFGQFILQQGWWNGKQIIAEAQMAALRIATGPNPGHGAFLWLNRPNGYSLGPTPATPGATAGFIYPTGHPEIIAALGGGKNRMYIIPGRDAVIVRQTTGDTTDFDDAAFLDLLLGSSN